MSEKLNQLLAIDGGEIKTTDVEGQVKGMGIVFGSPEQPDQSSFRDYFTPESYITRKNKKKMTLPLYYEHGEGLVKEEVGDAVLTRTEDGWTAEAQIDLELEAGKLVYEQIKGKQHGFSTGAMSHLVKRVPTKNNTNLLEKWVPGEISLTQWPAEKRATVYAVKSLGDELKYEPMWSEEEQKLRDESWVIALYSEDGNKIWDIEDGTPFPHESKDIKKIEVKHTSGSVNYNVYSYGDDEGGFEISAYQWGGAEDLIDKLQGLLNVAKQNLKSEEPVGEKDFEARVASVVKTMLESTENNKDVEELQEQLKTKDEEVAELKAQLKTAEESLADVQSEMNTLRIMLSAKETIENNKGK